MEGEGGCHILNTNMYVFYKMIRPCFVDTQSVNTLRTCVSDWKLRALFVLRFCCYVIRTSM